jgi:type I restriction enzyme S subunit
MKVNNYMNKIVIKYNYLKLIHFQNIYLWDVKRYLAKPLKSKYKFFELSEFIEEQNITVKPKLYPDKNFFILGVNNKIGLFDAYFENGRNIKQPYKIVNNNFLVYNPYRVNVGSIGFKTDNQKYNLISNAYVVFSCKNNLLPEYLYILFQTNTFNNIIRDNTSGSVRQNLTYELLDKICLPIPSLIIQKKLIEDYNKLLLKATKIQNKIKELEKDIDKYLLEILDINLKEYKFPKGLGFTRLKELTRWDIWNRDEIILGNKYEISTFENIIIGSPQYGSGQKAINKISNYRYIRITDLNEDGSLNNEIVSAKKIEDKYILKQFDFLFARSGATVGKSFLYEEKMGKAIYAGYLIRLRLNLEKVNPYYVLYFTKCSFYKRWINSNQRISAQPNINSKQFLEAPIILPDLNIQNKIVIKIRKMKNEIETLKKQAETNFKNARDNFESEIFVL